MAVRHDHRVPRSDEKSWYGVRSVFQHGPDDPEGTSYEERVTVWFAASFDQAIEFAEAEALEYVAGRTDVSDLGLFQAYALTDPPGHGSEVFSLIRDSHLGADDYLDGFFETGRERQQTVE